MLNISVFNRNNHLWLGSNTQSRFQHHMFHLFKKTPLTEWWQTSVRNTAMHSRSAWPCPWWKTPHIPSEHFWTSKRVKWTIDDVVDEHKKIFYPKKEIVKSALSMSGWRSACSLCLFEQRCRDRTTSFRERPFILVSAYIFCLHKSREVFLFSWWFYIFHRFFLLMISLS